MHFISWNERRVIGLAQWQLHWRNLYIAPCLAKTQDCFSLNQCIHRTMSCNMILLWALNTLVHSCCVTKNTRSNNIDIHNKSHLIGIIPTYCSFLNLWHLHNDVIKWKHFPRYWPFVQEGQWLGYVFFDLRHHKQSRRRWFETQSRSFWRHCNVRAGHMK